MHHFCRLMSFTNFNAQFLFSLTICMLHYNPLHVSSINMPIFRMTNYIITASGIVTLCTIQYSMPDESRLLCSLLSSGILHTKNIKIPTLIPISSNKGRFMWTPTFIFSYTTKVTCYVFIGAKNISNKLCRETQSTHFMLCAHSPTPCDCHDN